MRFILRLLGFLLLAAAIAALVYDLGGFAPPSDGGLTPLGALWFQIDPATLNMLQAGIERNVDPELWHGTIVPILQLPAVFVLAIPGLVLLLLSTFFKKKEKRKKRR